MRKKARVVVVTTAVVILLFAVLHSLRIAKDDNRRIFNLTADDVYLIELHSSSKSNVFAPNADDFQEILRFLNDLRYTSSEGYTIRIGQKGYRMEILASLDTFEGFAGNRTFYFSSDWMVFGGPNGYLDPATIYYFDDGALDYLVEFVE